MGGAKSKFAENDWFKADGKLGLHQHCNDKDTNNTIDGAPPTLEYGIYHLTKKKRYSQREFDVTDSSHNLLYTTRAVPGTIAVFDVLSHGQGMDDFLLRVHVDLARRYWIVCRYGVPTFPGQRADKVATEKLALEYSNSASLEQRQRTLSNNNAAPPNTFLYKKCCITVSWSRYMAVSALYGPPSVEMLLSNSSKEEEEDEEETDNDNTEIEHKEEAQKEVRKKSAEEDNSLFLQASSKIASSRMAERTVSVEHDDEAITIHHQHDNNNKNAQQDANGEPSAVELQIDHNNDDDNYRMIHMSQSQSMPEIASATEESTRTLRTWFRTQSQTIREKSQQAYLKMSIASSSYSSSKGVKKQPDPLEGVIHLDKPLLLCQEIYNRIIGNHQTSLVSKETVLELLQKDMAEHIREHPDDDFETQEQGRPLLSAEDMALAADEQTTADSCCFPSNGVPESKESDDIDIDAEVPSNNPVETKEEDATNNLPTTTTTSKAEEEQQQPLVGYWTWENTLRTHKMKMHVAKGADLCLHVVLAIIVNQVRYERNAVAMTV